MLLYKFINLFLVVGFLIGGCYFGFVGLSKNIYQEPQLQSIRSIQSSSKKTLNPAKPQIQEVTSSKQAIARRINLPILMYHGIDIARGSITNKIAEGLRVSPAAFEEQLKYLKNQGYNSVNSFEVDDYLLEKFELPPKPILLTFDDGMIDNYTNALPLLQKYNFKADFAIITATIDTNPSYMNLEQLKDLLRLGMSISSHTANHCALASKSGGIFLDSLEDSSTRSCNGFSTNERLTTGQVTFELETSKKTLEQKLGIRVRHLVYPIGAWNKQVAKIAKKLGYSFATTVASQKNEISDFDDPFELKRYRVSGQRTPELRGFFVGER